MASVDLFWIPLGAGGHVVRMNGPHVAASRRPKQLHVWRGRQHVGMLDHGGIVEQGSHQALMTAGGHYASLYNTYFRHQDPNYHPWSDEPAA